MAFSQCELVSLDRYNWELLLKIELHESQQAFTPSILYSLAQANFEQLTPYGISYRGEIVGFLMYGQFGGICWINRILVDHRFQAKGIGTAALTQIIRKLRQQFDCREIRTSYAEGNEVAAKLFSTNGFVPIGSAMADGEVVLRYEG